jgi:hypothetical protein
LPWVENCWYEKYEVVRIGLVAERPAVKVIDSQFEHIYFIFVLLAWLLLAIGNRAAAISKLGVPELDEQDLPFYLEKPAHQDDHHLYLFSSLALISRRRAAAAFELSDSPTSGIAPLLRLEVHPPVEASFQSEFFDVTIWGQLSNLFQKNIETVAIEREIMALFKELEELNARYIALLSSQAGNSFETGRPLTLDRSNYLQRRPGADIKQEDTSEATQEILSLVQQHESAGQTERLASQLALRTGVGRAPALEARASAAASMRAAEAQQDAEGTGTTPGGWIVYVFRLFRLVIRYLLQNKIATMIYLWALILLSIFVKAAFRRS